MTPAIIISLVSVLIPIINNALSFIGKAKEAIAGDSNWTDEQRAAFLAELDKLEKDPEVWQKVQPI